MIERYLAELDAALPGFVPRRRRLLREVEDHLRDAAREHGEAAALARFGSVATVARGLRRPLADSAGRVAALAVGLVGVWPFVSYPIPENALPPAPWRSADSMPAELAWKQAAVMLLSVTALGMVALAAPLLRRGGRALLVALVVSLVPLGAVAGIGLALGVQWAHAVPGTPAWLLAVPLVQVAGVAVAGLLLGRAAALSRSITNP